MKKYLALLLVVFSGILMASCGGNPSSEPVNTDKSAGQENNNHSAADGFLYTGEKIEIFIPEGWSYTDDMAGIKPDMGAGFFNMKRKGKEFYVMLKFQFDNSQTPEQYLGAFINNFPQYNPTPMKPETHGGTQYQTTSYVYGLPQTQYAAKINNTMITITVQGRDHAGDPDVRTILENIKYKL